MSNQRNLKEKLLSQSKIHETFLNESSINNVINRNRTFIESNERKLKSVSFFKLQYSFTSGCERLIIIVASLFSILTGLAMPAFSMLFGITLNQFYDDDSDLDLLFNFMIYFFLVGLLTLLSSLVMIYLWSVSGKIHVNKLKENYFKVLMSQDQSFFDQQNMFEFTTKIQSQCELIENGLGSKVGNALLAISTCTSSFVLGFLISWRLSLALCIALPFLCLSGLWVTSAMQSDEEKKRTYFEEAGGIAEECLYNIKTIASFCNFGFEMRRFNKRIENSLVSGIKDGLKTGLALLTMIFITYLTYALAIYYGAYLIKHNSKVVYSDQTIQGGDIVAILLSIVFGSYALGQTFPNLKAISVACNASIQFFNLVERVPLIYSLGLQVKPNKEIIEGSIEFKDVSFSYPNDQDKVIFDKLSFQVKSGQKVAFVGESGSGKSTIVNLLERLYETTGGDIYLDNFKIKDIEIQHLRNIFGYVGQEPVLFNMSIRDNIIFGRKNFSEEELIEACKKSYAWDFIKDLDGQLEYVVGIRGSKLSGGQKQRIAIARAILDNPKILILDEATSALDNKTEKEIQKSLDNISKGITTIIIAHRLSTIINSDSIFVLNKGKIIEKGNHTELMELGGQYRKLIQSQLDKTNRLDKIDRRQLTQLEDTELDVMFNRLSGSSTPNKLVEYVKMEMNLSKSNSFTALARTDALFTKAKINFMSQQEKNFLKDPYDERISIHDLESLDSVLNQVQKANIEEAYYANAQKRLLSVLSKHKALCFWAGLSGLLNGSTYPVYGFLLGNAINNLYPPGEISKYDILSKATTSAIYFIVYAILASAITFFQQYF